MDEYSHPPMRTSATLRTRGVCCAAEEILFNRKEDVLLVQHALVWKVLRPQEAQMLERVREAVIGEALQMAGGVRSFPCLVFSTGAGWMD